LRSIYQVGRRLEELPNETMYSDANDAFIRAPILGLSTPYLFSDVERYRKIILARASNARMQKER